MVSPSAHRSLCTAELKGKQNIILSGWRLLRLIRAIICNCRAEGTILPKDNVARSPSGERTLKRKDQTHDDDTLSAILKISIEKTCFYFFFLKINLRLSLSPVSLNHPPTSHSSTCSTTPPTPCPPILLVSLDMLPSPLPTHFSAPLHFGHSYIYGAIRCSSPSRASRITAHTELWRAGKGGGVLGVCGVRGEVERGEDGGIFKWGGD